MYENERKRCSEVENQLREQYKQYADIFKRLLENEISKQNELFSIESMQRLFTELKREITENFTKSEDAHKNEMLDKGNIIDEEILKQKVLTEKLKEEITQLKNQLMAYEKQWECYTKSYKESEEVYKKELHSLQLKLEEFKREGDEKFKECKEMHRKEIYTLHIKIEELVQGKDKKYEDTESVQQKKETKSDNALSPQPNSTIRQAETYLNLQLQVNEETKCATDNSFEPQSMDQDMADRQALPKIYDSSKIKKKSKKTQSDKTKGN